MLYDRSLLLIYFIHGGLYFLVPYSYFATLSFCLPIGNEFVSCICESLSILLNTFLLFSFLDSTCKWYWTVFDFLWRISLSVIFSRSIHVVANGRILFFFFCLDNSLLIFIPDNTKFFILNLMTTEIRKIFCNIGVHSKHIFKYIHIYIYIHTPEDF